MTAYLALDLLLVGLVLFIAIRTTIARDTFGAIAGFVAYGLLLTIVWVRLSAIDVAMTEAAIGSGVTGVLLLRAGARFREPESTPKAGGKGFRTLVAILCALVSAGLAAVVLTPPSPAPSLAVDVAAHLDLTGMKNPVNGVLMAYRAMDTFLETVVVLLALIGVWSLTPDRYWGGRPGRPTSVEPDGALVLLARLLPPAGIVIGIYIVWVGAEAPGGKFQGATILAAMWILAMGARLAGIPAISSGRLRFLLLVGPIVFVAVGALGFWMSGYFLSYPPALAKPFIVGIEVALTLSIAVTLGLLVAGPPEREPEP